MSRREKLSKLLGSSDLPLRFETVPAGLKQLPIARAPVALAPHPRNVVVTVSLPPDDDPSLAELLQQIGESCLVVPGYELAEVEHVDFASKTPGQPLRGGGSISTWTLTPRPAASDDGGSRS